MLERTSGSEYVFRESIIGIAVTLPLHNQAVRMDHGRS
jgi:hypothetical protein